MRSRATRTNPRIECNRRALPWQRTSIRRSRRSEPQRFRFPSPRPCRCMETGELAEEIFVTFCESPSYLSVMQCAAPDGVQVTQQTAAISDDDHVNALEEGST